MLSKNFKESVKSFVANDEAFSFMSTTIKSRVLRCISVISKLNGLNLSQDDESNINYFQNVKFLNSNPVLLARHFQYCVEVFLKKIIIDEPLGKVKYHAIRVSHFLLSTIVSLLDSAFFKILFSLIFDEHLVKRKF